MNAVKRDRPGSELAWPEERFDKLFRDMFRDFFSRGLLHEPVLRRVAEPDACRGVRR